MKLDVLMSRGGGGNHPSWHEMGSGPNKINSVYDLISCGKYLVDEGYAKNGRLAAIGSSAGSLSVGAAINFHPDLFRAVILKVNCLCFFCVQMRFTCSSFQISLLIV